MGSRLLNTLKLLLLLWALLATGLGIAWVVEALDQAAFVALLIKGSLLIGVFGLGAFFVGLLLARPTPEAPRDAH